MLYGYACLHHSRNLIAALLSPDATWLCKGPRRQGTAVAKTGQSGKSQSQGRKESLSRTHLPPLPQPSLLLPISTVVARHCSVHIHWTAAYSFSCTRPTLACGAVPCISCSWTSGYAPLLLPTPTPTPAPNTKHQTPLSRFTHHLPHYHAMASWQTLNTTADSDDSTENEHIPGAFDSEDEVEQAPQQARQQTTQPRRPAPQAPATYTMAESASPIGIANVRITAGSNV